MRIILILLLFANIGYGLWNVVQYRHLKEITLQESSISHLDSMPGKILESLTPNLDNQSAQNNLTAKLVENQACIALGPIQKNEDIKNIIERLASIGKMGTKYLEEVTGDVDFWVYLPPEPSREMAANKLRELQEKKIDSFIIPEGELTNGISLGVFDKEENAERHQQQIISYGYKAEIKSNKSTYQEGWIIIIQEEHEIEQSLKEMPAMFKEDYRDIGAKKINCNVIANMQSIN